MRAAAVVASLVALMFQELPPRPRPRRRRRESAASIVADRIQLLTRDTGLEARADDPLAFDAHHPQGMARIGDTLIVSSVEVKVRTTRYPAPVNGLDRDAGEARAICSRSTCRDNCSPTCGLARAHLSPRRDRLRRHEPVGSGRRGPVPTAGRSSIASIRDRSRRPFFASPITSARSCTTPTAARCRGELGLAPLLHGR